MDTRKGGRTIRHSALQKEFRPSGMYTTRSDVRYPSDPAAENHRFSSAEHLCPFSTPTTKRWYQSGDDGSEPSPNPYHSRCNSCRPTTTTTTTPHNRGHNPRVHYLDVRHKTCAPSMGQVIHPPLKKGVSHAAFSQLLLLLVLSFHLLPLPTGECVVQRQ